MTFKQIAEFSVIDSDTKVLAIHGHEIGLVYYRTGYCFEQYECERDWKVREDVECSMAIKLPTIDLHLLTAKKA